VNVFFHGHVSLKSFFALLFMAWIENNNVMAWKYFIHFLLLGMSDKESENSSDKDSDTEGYFGQEQVPLTDEIREILEEYPDGQIFKVRHGL